MIRKSTPGVLCLVAFLLIWAVQPLVAQQNDNDSQVTVIQTITSDDGTVVVKKKKLNKGEDLDAYMDALELEGADSQKVEVEISGNNGDSKNFFIFKNQENDEDGETLFFFNQGNCLDKKDGSDVNTLRIVTKDTEDVWEWDSKDEKYDNQHFNHNWKNKNNWHYSWSYDDHHGNHHQTVVTGTRPLLGVYLDEDENQEGILLSGVTSSGGAKAAGLQRGDVVLSLNGNAVDNVYDLRNELGKFEPGDAVNVTYRRDGQEYQTSSVLGSKPTYSRYRDPCRVFIGVVIGDYDYNPKGVRIQRIVDNTSAEEAGLLAGDYIVAIDGVPINTHSEVVTERDKHEPGDYYTITVDRNGSQLTIDAQFKACDKDEPTITETPEEVITEEIVPPTETPELEIINNSLEVQDFSSFPNPTYDNIRVRFQSEAAPTVIQVTDITGKTVHREVLNSFDGFYDRQLNLGNATPGTMILTIQQGEKVFSNKFVLLSRA